MLFHNIFYLVSSLIYFTYCQSIIRIGIIDDNDNHKGIINIKIPNITYCAEKYLNLQLYWINTSNSLSNLLSTLESEQNFTNIYLSNTINIHTKLIQDFCQVNYIPFIDMKSYESKTMINPTFVILINFYLHSFCFFRSFIGEYFIIPNILQVLINYLKYNHIQKAAYIYNNNTDSSERISELLKLMNYDEYFNNFSLDIRIIYYEDIYSLLYNIEVNYLYKQQLTRYILLDLNSYEDYKRMFEKISHMGLYFIIND